jgi:hypothetical protein
MNSLTDLRDAFVREGTAKIEKFNGYELHTTMGLFELAHDQFWRNGQTISKKELRELIHHEIKPRKRS